MLAMVDGHRMVDPASIEPFELAAVTRQWIEQLDRRQPLR